MTYDEAIEATVTKAEALAEIRTHEADVEFYAFCVPRSGKYFPVLEEMGDYEEYDGGDVLSWLGY